jgi:hypothetical protein
MFGVQMVVLFGGGGRNFKMWALAGGFPLGACIED